MIGKDTEKADHVVPSDAQTGDKNVVEMSREPAAPASARLEAIQDILFGEQLRTSNEQISQMQEQNEQTLQNLSNSIDQRFDELASSMNSKIDSLVQQLTEQKNTQNKADERLTGGIAACKTALTHTIDATREDLTKQINGMADEMDHKKLDASKLSQMFTQIGAELGTNSSITTTPKS